MAHRAVRRVIHNPGRRRSGGLSDKQIKFFGTPAQKAALKRKRSRKRNAGPRRLFRTRLHKAATRPRRVKRSNPGEILSLVANPAKRSQMAKTRKRKRAASRPNPARRSRRRRSAAPVHHRRRTRRSNPGMFSQRRRRRHVTTRRRRSNPSRSGGGVSGLFTNALWLIGGAVGTRVIAQAVLGAKNTGVMGYIGNAVTAFGLSLIVGKLFKNPTAARSVLAGGIVSVVLRLISDYTPLGAYTSQLGLGDYQVSNWVTPQRYKDALNSAEVEIPAGWAPTVIQSNAAPGAGPGMAGVASGLYSSGGLYSS